MITLNLLPDIKRDYLRARQLETRVISIAIIVMLASVALLVLTALFVYGGQGVHMKLLGSSIDNNRTELRKIPDIDKIATVQSQLANLDALHDGKTMYSRVFSILPRLNPREPNSVTLTGLELAAETDTLSLEGVTNNFTGLETFRDTMRNAKLRYTAAGSSESTTTKLFSDVQVASQSLATNPETNAVIVTFKLSAVYDKAAFARTSNAVDVEVPNLETTQSKQNTPNVFGGTR